MNLPDISVLMPVYNGEQYLHKAIESILNQTFTNFEFIIINDGSTDNSCGIINKYASKDKRILPITQNNIGLTKSLNKGIQIAKGKYIARQDADDYSSSDRFFNQFFILESMEEVGIVASGYYVFSEKEKFGEMLIPKIRDFPRVNVFAHGSLMFRADLVRKNPYDERYIYAQDYELVFRLFKQTKIYIVPNVLYYLRKDLIYNFEKYQFYLQISERSLKTKCTPINKPVNPREITALKKGMDKRYYNFLTTILRRRKEYNEAFEMYKNVPKDLSIKYLFCFVAYFLLNKFKKTFNSLPKNSVF